MESPCDENCVEFCQDLSNFQQQNKATFENCDAMIRESSTRVSLFDEKFDALIREWSDSKQQFKATGAHCNAGLDKVQLKLDNYSKIVDEMSAKVGLTFLFWMIEFWNFRLRNLKQ